MREFDVEAVSGQLNRVQNTGGEPGCRVKLLRTPGGNPYLRILTSYEVIRHVLPQIVCIAQTNHLAAYDAETGNTFFHANPTADAFIDANLRCHQLLQAIRADVRPVFSVRRLENRRESFQMISCAVTLGRSEESFLQRIQAFLLCLRRALHPDEELRPGPDSFRVCGKGYILQFIVEGYKKHASRIGFMQNDHAGERLLDRMNCEAAFRYINTLEPWRKADILQRMQHYELTLQHPNPAERLIRSIRLEQELRKLPFSVRRTSVDAGYQDDFIFHRVCNPLDSQDRDELSCLQVEEEAAQYILAVISEFYPYIYDRYYVAENHLPEMMLEDVCLRMEEIKEMLFSNRSHPGLIRYADRLGEHRFLSEDPVRFLIGQRHAIAGLFNLFIRWYRDQTLYNSEFMINVQGP